MKKIIEMLKQANSIALFTHCNADLDAYGSVGAMYHYLKSEGKEVCIFLCEELNPKFDFLKLQDVSFTPSEKKFDLYMSLDCSTLDRIEQYSTMFKSGFSISVDHHFGGDVFYNLGLIDSSSAATCEILFDFFEKNNIDISKDIATCLYMGIMGDTGCLMHDNTTSKTLNYISKLLNFGADVDCVKQLLTTKTLQEVKAYEMIINSMHITNNIAVAVLTKKDKKKLGVDRVDTSDISNLLLSIGGVHISALLKQSDKNIWRVSLRSKKHYDVASFCKKMGGGGHKQAAGYTAIGNLAFVKKQLLENLKNIRKSNE